VQSVDLCEAWALAGYVVAAPNHVGNTLMDANAGEKMAEVGLRRPDDIAATLSFVTDVNDDPGEVLFDRVDVERVAVAGHSFGALTALVVSGAAIDVVGARTRCDAGDDLKGACDMLAELTDDLYVGRPPSLENIRAGIALSPAVWGLFGELGLSKVTAPVFVGAGTLDTVTPVKEHAEPIYAALPKPRALAMFPTAGHYAFSNFCDIPDIETLSGGVIAECDEQFIDSHEAMAITATLTLAWLDAYVRDDPAPLAALEETAAAQWSGTVDVMVESK